MRKYQILLLASLITSSCLVAKAATETPSASSEKATVQTPGNEQATPAQNQPPKLTAAQINQKILESGISPDALKRFNKYLYEHNGRAFYQDTYSCEGRPSESIRPCEDRKRSQTAQKVVLGNPRYNVIVDYSLPSTERRLFFIDRATGNVGRYYVSHGIGSGNGNYAYKFSNRKDSRMTSLGFYLTGGIYDGKYGKTLRMYGLQRSNDQAYNRDIVFHGAWYVGEDFINSINAKTKEPYGRLGVSWGCPAVSSYIAWKLLPYISEGSVIFHYHNKLLDKAQSGQEVSLPKEEIPVEKTTSNPEANTTKEEFDQQNKESKTQTPKAAPADNKAQTPKEAPADNKAQAPKASQNNEAPKAKENTEEDKKSPNSRVIRLVR